MWWVLRRFGAPLWSGSRPRLRDRFRIPIVYVSHQFDEVMRLATHVVLMDGGCGVEGYQSDVTRTFVFGKPTARQTEIWNLERKAQDAA